MNNIKFSIIPVRFEKGILILNVEESVDRGGGQIDYTCYYVFVIICIVLFIIPQYIHSSVIIENNNKII